MAGPGRVNVPFNSTWQLAEATAIASPPRARWPGTSNCAWMTRALTRYVAKVHTRPLFVVVLAPAIAVVRAREAARPKAGYGVWTVEAPDHALRAETPRIALWLDTSEHTPTLTVSAFSTTSRPRRWRAADPRHHAARLPKPASSQP